MHITSMILWIVHARVATLVCIVRARILLVVCILASSSTSRVVESSQQIEARSACLNTVLPGLSCSAVSEVRLTLCTFDY